MADEPTRSRSFKEIFLSITPIQIVCALIGLMVIVGLVWALQSDFFSRLGGKDDFGYARGLITFSVAIVTVAIALILVIAAIVGDGTELEKRLGFGKDILLVFVGMLGTIMGFYYGTGKVTPQEALTLVKSEQPKTTPTPVSFDGMPIESIERIGVDALIKADFRLALEGFDAAYKLAPRRHNIDEIRSLLRSKASAMQAASDAGNNTEIASIWKQIHCEIINRQLTWKLDGEAINAFKTNCEQPAPSAN